MNMFNVVTDRVLQMGQALVNAATEKKKEEKKKKDPFLDGFNLFEEEENKEKTHLDFANSGGKRKSTPTAMPRGFWIQKLSEENEVQKAAREKEKENKTTNKKKEQEKQTKPAPAEEKKKDLFLDGFNLFDEEENEEKNHLDFVRSGGKSNQKQEEKRREDLDELYPELRLKLSDSKPEKTGTEQETGQFGRVGKALMDRWEKVKSGNLSKSTNAFYEEIPELGWGKGEKHYITNEKTPEITLPVSLDTLESISSIAEWIPGIGNAAGLLSAIINLAQGDRDEALLDGIGMVPIVGNIISKAIDAGKGVKKAGKAFGLIDDVVALGKATSKTAGKIENVIDIVKPVDKIDDAYNSMKIAGGIDDVVDIGK
ncbi:MAG: hypothetical protein E7473_01010, partial [Ruminococcaceae bacterium]|nr:hypothetical protein [Oscillospiraceae bacterium]